MSGEEPASHATPVWAALSLIAGAMSIILLATSQVGLAIATAVAAIVLGAVEGATSRREKRSSSWLATIGSVLGLACLVWEVVAVMSALP